MNEPTTDQTHMKELEVSMKTAIIDTLNNVESMQYQHAKFETFFKSEVYELFQYINYELFDTMYEKIKEDVIRTSNQTWRSFKENLHYFDYENDRFLSRVEELKNIPQPQQRTEEWYEFRRNHLTGSNSWKIFSSESCQNQLMYEKLEPYVKVDYTKPNLNDQQPMNWGHKYEPLSVLLYEYYNDVRVEDFGCIEHEKIKCLAASPDGIVTSLKNNGRMIEVKNPTTREITQTPKMDYYIQMQIQMEVCNLEECDFVETKFKEYDNYEQFKNDKYKIEKGMIIVFIKDGNELAYEYSPLFSNKPDDLEKFTNSVYDKYNFKDGNLENGKYRWFKNIYWYLDTFSCVLVPRNHKWFSVAEDKIKQFWENVLKERKNPSSHLKYKAKTKTNNVNVIKTSSEPTIVVLD